MTTIFINEETRCPEELNSMPAGAAKNTDNSQSNQNHSAPPVKPEAAKAECKTESNPSRRKNQTGSSPKRGAKSGSFNGATLIQAWKQRLSQTF